MGSLIQYFIVKTLIKILKMIAKVSTITIGLLAMLIGISHEIACPDMSAEIDAERGLDATNKHETAVGTVITFFCTSGTLTGDYEVVCGEDGNWIDHGDGDDPECFEEDHENDVDEDERMEELESELLLDLLLAKKMGKR